MCAPRLPLRAAAPGQRRPPDPRRRRGLDWCKAALRPLLARPGFGPVLSKRADYRSATGGGVGAGARAATELDDEEQRGTFRSRRRPLPHRADVAAVRRAAQIYCASERFQQSRRSWGAAGATLLLPFPTRCLARNGARCPFQRKSGCDGQRVFPSAQRSGLDRGDRHRWIGPRGAALLRPARRSFYRWSSRFARLISTSIEIRLSSPVENWTTCSG